MNVLKIFARIEWKDTSKNPQEVKTTPKDSKMFSLSSPRANKKTELTPRVITRFDRYPKSRKVPEREQADRDEIESDQFIQASPHDSGWVVG